MRGAAITHTVRLADGGTVGFQEYGNPDGRPCLFLHGTPGSSLTAGWLFAKDDVLVTTARLIAIDRPGAGASSPASTPVFGAGVAALFAVADELELDVFDVLAVSGGAAFGLLAAVQHPERVRRLLLLSTALPLSRSERRQLTTGARIMQQLCRAAPGLARWLLTRSSSAGARRLGEDARPTEAGVPAADARFLDGLRSDAERRGSRAAELELTASRRAVGAVAELAAYGRAWAIRPEYVLVPVVAWHGTEDEAAPFEPTRRFVEAIPNGTLHAVAGGHLAPLTETAAVAAALTMD